ncbi:MAG: hypothetical protein ACI4MV_01670 [Christensenellales bacterium]
MTKKIVVAALVAVMLVSCLFVLSACDQGAGTYVYKTPITGTSNTIKLSAFGKADIDVNIANVFKYTGEAKWSSAKNDDGVVVVTLTWEEKDENGNVVKGEDGKPKTVSFDTFTIDKDGNLVFGIITFEKQ